MQICDLHTHVMPGVDDGAQSPEQALQMLKNAVASDVSVLVVTPHCNVPGTEDNYNTDQLLRQFAQLQQLAAGMPIRLLLGAEARYTQQLPQLLRQGQIPTLNASRYVLLEFHPLFPGEAFAPALQEVLDCGFVPLIAHPERYAEVCRDPAMTEQWLDMGCHLQVTGGSVLGAYGRNAMAAARQLLQRDLVCCIASDAHGETHRSNFLMDVYDHLCLYYSKQYARCLLYTNPMAICNDNAF